MNSYHLKKLFKLSSVRKCRFQRYCIIDPILLERLIFQDFLPGDRASRLMIS